MDILIFRDDFEGDDNVYLTDGGVWTGFAEDDQTVPFNVNKTFAIIQAEGTNVVTTSSGLPDAAIGWTRGITAIANLIPPLSTPNYYVLVDVTWSAYLQGEVGVIARYRQSDRRHFFIGLNREGFVFEVRDKLGRIQRVDLVAYSEQPGPSFYIGNTRIIAGNSYTLGIKVTNFIDNNGSERIRVEGTLNSVRYININYSDPSLLNPGKAGFSAARYGTINNDFTFDNFEIWVMDLSVGIGDRLDTVETLSITKQILDWYPKVADKAVALETVAVKKETLNWYPKLIEQARGLETISIKKETLNWTPRIIEEVRGLETVAIRKETLDWYPNLADSLRALEVIQIGRDDGSGDKLIDIIENIGFNDSHDAIPEIPIGIPTDREINIIENVGFNDSHDAIPEIPVGIPIDRQINIVENIGFNDSHDAIPEIPVGIPNTVEVNIIESVKMNDSSPTIPEKFIGIPTNLQFNIIDTLRASDSLKFTFTNFVFILETFFALDSLNRTLRMPDSMNISESIIINNLIQILDKATVTELLRVKAFIGLSDSATIDEIINVIRHLKETMTVSDVLALFKQSEPMDTMRTKEAITITKSFDQEPDFVQPDEVTEVIKEKLVNVINPRKVN